MILNKIQWDDFSAGSQDAPEVWNTDFLSAAIKWSSWLSQFCVFLAFRPTWSEINSWRYYFKRGNNPLCLSNFWHSFPCIVNNMLQIGCRQWYEHLLFYNVACYWIQSSNPPVNDFRQVQNVRETILIVSPGIFHWHILHLTANFPAPLWIMWRSHTNDWLPNNMEIFNNTGQWKA